MRWPSAVGWAVIYLTVAFFFLAPLSFETTDRLPDDGDALQNLWIVWWSATHWARGYPGILDANGYYPHGNAILNSEPQFSEALLATPLFALSNNHVLVYNFFLLLTLAASGWCAHLWLRELTSSSLAAALGAVTFVFNGYTLSHLARSQLVTLQWIPLALFFLHRYFDRDQWRYLVPFAATSTLLGFGSFYYLQFFLLILGVLAPAYLWAYRDHWLRRATTLAVALLGFALPIGVVALEVLERLRLYGFESERQQTDLIDYFVPAHDNPLYGFLPLAPRSVVLFLGFGALALAALGVWRLAKNSSAPAPKAVLVGYGVAGVLAFCFSAGPDLVVGGVHLGPGLFQLLEFLGPPSHIRDPGRLSLIVRVSTSVFVAFGALSLVGPSPRRRVLVGLVGLFLVLEQWSPARTAGVVIPTGDGIPEVYRWVAERGGDGPLVELPVRPYGQVRLNGLDAYFSTYHDRPYLFGKASVVPPAQELFRTELYAFPSARSIDLLGAIGVQLALVFPDRWGEEERPHREALLRQAEHEGRLIFLARFEGLADVAIAERYGLGPARAYAIARPKPPPPRPPCRCREIPRDTFTVSGSGEVDPTLAIDGDPNTAWTTGLFQEKGDFFEIGFGQLRRPARVEIELTYPYDGLGRDVRVNGFRGERFWRLERVDDYRDTVALVQRLVENPIGARLRFELEPREVDRMRLFLYGVPSVIPGWEIAEIFVFEQEGSSEPRSTR